MSAHLNWTHSHGEPRLISVGEIDSHGRYQHDSNFHHRHNAEKWARLLLSRGAFRVAIDSVVYLRSRLAKEMDAE